MKEYFPLQLYTLFHLNTAYSSIEEEERFTLLRRCYHPLLDLAGELNLPLAIEASGCTLESIEAVDPGWIERLRKLVAAGTVEFIGSGYAQLIGPLVPAAVNAANLRLGEAVYRRLLKTGPGLALVNEQAYSAGLVRHYLDVGYSGIIMEWDNPSFCHKDWDPTWRYLPQYALGPQDEEIALIWNKSIAFQKFQRYAHGDLELEAYLDYLQSHLGDTRRFFPLYGNDVEIFDYRPGRYQTEALLHEDGEWNRLAVLFKTLLEDPRFTFVFPSLLLDGLGEAGAGNRLRLESAQQPVPVKKQGKYNLTRWAVTGRDDLGINTACRRIYSSLEAAGEAATADHWRRLCYLWSSDFRTHITAGRWTRYLQELKDFEEEVRDLLPGAMPGKTPGAAQGQVPPATPRDYTLPVNSPPVNPLPDSALPVNPPPVNSLPDSAPPGSALPPKKSLSESAPPGSVLPGSLPPVQVSRRGHFLTLETDRVGLTLNCRRGLAIESFYSGTKNKGTFLLGTLPHGYYNDIRYGADWYSGHLVLERPGRPKVTDLEPVEPVVEQSGSLVTVEGEIACELGSIIKKVVLDTLGPKLSISYRLNWADIPSGSFRLGFLTLNPQYYARDSLFYRTTNGGFSPEHFALGDESVNHGAAVSFLVSAACGLGLTDGWIEVGDKNSALRVTVNSEAAALVGLVTYNRIDGSYFYRLAFSAGEMDDTSKFEQGIPGQKFYELGISPL